MPAERIGSLSSSLEGDLAMTFPWISDMALLEVFLPETTDCSPCLLAGLAWARRKAEPASEAGLIVAGEIRLRRP